MSKIAVLGTGLLGTGFAENLIKLGHDVVVWNRTASKTEPLVALGATAAPTAADAVRGAERVHMVLTDDRVVDAVVTACREGLDDGAWLIDHSTNLPEKVAARFTTLRADGIRYVPAPVFMSPQNAREAGGLMLLAASDDEAAALTPILQTMTGRVWHVGERSDLAAVYKISGNGALIAMAGIAGDLFAIGHAHGLTPTEVVKLFEVFPVGKALPGIAKRVQHAPNMPASFELSMARKDVGLMIDAAGGRDNLVALPGIADAMDAAIANGKADKDFAVLGWPNRD